MTVYPGGTNRWGGDLVATLLHEAFYLNSNGGAEDIDLAGAVADYLASVGRGLNPSQRIQETSTDHAAGNFVGRMFAEFCRPRVEPVTVPPPRLN